jgi:isoleucyl-tRNA synthetase
VLRGQNLSIDREGKGIAEVVRLALNPLWNAYYFFCLYANPDGVKAETRSDSTQLLDRYVLAKTRELVEKVTERLESYDIPGACHSVGAFVDTLTNWYIRRSRPRFWAKEATQDKQDAYDTLYTVLTTALRCFAPLLPLLSEEIYRGLTGERSVHLGDWPDPEALPADPQLVEQMDRVREVCSAGLAVRKAHDLRIRLPLRRLTVAGRPAESIRPYLDLVKDELNVKEVVITEGMEELGEFLLKVNARVVGPRLGGSMKAVMVASKKGDWEARPDGSVRCGEEVLQEGEFELLLKAREGVASQALPGNETLVALDVEITPELEREGLARDTIRVIQQARKDADLHVSDRIRIRLGCSAEVRAAVEAHLDDVKTQTLADEIGFVSAEATQAEVRRVVG